MARTKVFISHIQENASIATALKRFIDDKFLGAATVFVSSDGDISPGDYWQQRLVTEIRESDLVLVVCTNASVHRPWINFEAGGALVRGAQVIPVCWHGCMPSLLPPPFGHLQALDLESEQDILRFMEIIAIKAEMRIPQFEAKDLLKELPMRYTEQIDLTPSMFLGLDFMPPRGLRLEREYGIDHRRALIKPYRSLKVEIKSDRTAILRVKETVVYLEHQDSRTLKVFLSCRTNQEFRELDFQIEDAEITGWTRVSDTVVGVEVRCNTRIRLLQPFCHRYSWKPPMIWGEDFDSISIPIEQPTGQQDLHVTSEIPIHDAIAFKDIQTIEDSDTTLAEKALKIRDYGCPPVIFSPPGDVRWTIELPEIQANYRIGLYYKDGKYS